MIIQYDTALEIKRSAVETIVPTLDKGVQWRVSGYFVRVGKSKSPGRADEVIE